MPNRHHGYNVSVSYTALFFPQMAPDWLDLCMRVQGFEPQRTGGAYRYLDLGSGQGFHLCLLAAANPQADFVGVDFLAEHIAHGRDLAAAAGLTNVTFLEADFIDLAADWPNDLGTFDYIGLQGILSWVSADLRAAVFECVAHASHSGSVSSFGYNCKPGWLKTTPFQHIANEMSKRSTSEEALASAFSTFRRLSDAKAPVFEQLPLMKKQLEVMGTQPISYLAHEFLTDNWCPLWHSTVARALADSDIGFVGSATIADSLMPDALPPELSGVIRDEPDAFLREDLQDIVVTQQFRRDIFCREPAAAANGRDFDGETLVHLFAAPSPEAPVRFRMTFAGVTVNYSVIANIIDALVDGPKRVADLMALETTADRNTRSIVVAMLDAEMLVVGAKVPGLPKVAQSFNAAVARAVASGKSYHYLAAAALGSGVPASELDILLLDAWLSAGGGVDQSGLAEGLADRLQSLGRHLQFRGAAITGEQLHSRAADLAGVFMDQTLPKWRSLGIVE